MLIQAFANLKLKDWHLTIIGDGPQKPLLHDLVSYYNLVSLTHFSGFLKGKDLVDELNRHEIMVIPSLWNEPFGVVALEGLACGCAMLASDGGGLPDAVGPAGLLFKRGNQQDLNTKLKMLVSDSSLRRDLRQNAHHHLSLHTASFIGDQYLSVLGSFLNE